MNAEMDIRGDQNGRRSAVLNGAATALVAELQSELGPRREELLARRHQLQSDLAQGSRPGFRPVVRQISAPGTGGSRLPRQTWPTGESRSPVLLTPK